jgi:hypothetical protein
MKRSSAEGEKEENGIVSALTSLQSEFAQLTELDEMEKTYTSKLIESFKTLQSGMDITLPLAKEVLGDEYSSAKEAYLAAEGVVITVREDGKVAALPLASFGPKVILEIVQASTPELGRIISERRQEVGTRVDLLERILKELKKAGTLMKQSSHGMPEAISEDLVQNSITSE